MLRVYAGKWLICGILVHIAQGSLVAQSHDSMLLTKAEEMQKYLNETADPCEDFYNFACGNWQKLNRATTNEPHKSVLMNMSRDFDLELVKLLEDRSVLDNEIEIKVKDFYQSCLTRPDPDTDMYQNALKDIVNEFGFMPVLEADKWQENDFDWLKTVANIAYTYNIMIIMGYSHMPNPDNTTINRLVVGRQDFALPLAFYFNNTMEPYWNERKVRVANNLIAYFNLELDLARNTAHELIDFEVRLAKGADRDRYEMEEFLVKTSARRMHRKYSPQLNIKAYLLTSMGVLPWDFIFEKNEGYQQNLIEVLKTTPKKTVANYIFYSLVHRFGSSETSCIGETKKHFLNLLHNMWYRRHDISRAKKAILNLFEDFSTVFYSALGSDRYKWISTRVRRYSKEKLHALSVHFKTYEETNFTLEYGQLFINKSDYMGNLKAIYRLSAFKNRARLYEPYPTYYDPLNMPITPMYIRNEHRIIVSLASLQSPAIWSVAYPNAVNLGQLGFLLAHEILHAFDDESRFKDKLGNEADWWDVRSKVYFNDRTECFLAQHRNYTYNGQPWPVSPIQSENIADNSGIALAYETYRLWHDDKWRPQTNLHLEQLPSLKYKNKQLFFISYAQTLCSDTHHSYYPYVVAKNTHLPDNLRVLGSLSNLAEFSEVFQCPEGSLMNPVNKCKVF